MLFMTFVIDGPGQAKTQLAGLIAAHLYDFLTRIWPTFGGGRNYIFTPRVVKRWFGGGVGVPQDRGYGYAVPGRSAGDDSSARSTGSAWGAAGPGRRLG
jgi:Derlin-2/3